MTGVKVDFGNLINASRESAPLSVPNDKLIASPVKVIPINLPGPSNAIRRILRAEIM
ncbi:hypothetical protein BGZ47_011719, partial [Haplosporangium gracile]